MLSGELIELGLDSCELSFDFESVRDLLRLGKKDAETISQRGLIFNFRLEIKVLASDIILTDSATGDFSNFFQIGHHRFKRLGRSPDCGFVFVFIQAGLMKHSLVASDDCDRFF